MTSRKRGWCALILAGTVLVTATCGRADPLPITVLRDDWGEAGIPDITRLLENVRDVFFESLRQAPEGILHVHRGQHNPLIAFQDKADGPTHIYLDTQGRHWCQFSYQFSHELCHFLSGYNRLRQGRESKTYTWLYETLCETASWYTLRRMAVTWETKPPYRNWKSYRHSLNSYVDELQNDPAYHLPAGMSLAAWYRINAPLLQNRGTLRDLNKVATAQWLPLFEANPVGWNALAALPAAESDDLATYFTAWKTAAAPEDRAFIEKLGATLLDE